MPETLQRLFLLAAPFSLILQIALCVHVYKTGRPYWWIWIIFMGSLLGCVVYALVELLPDVKRNSPRLVRTSWLVPRSIRLRRAREVVEESPTVENKLALAALLSDLDRAAEAEAVAVECPSGVFKRDPEVIAEVAWYELAVGKLAESETLLDQADAKHNRVAKARLDLLRARVLLGKNDLAGAHALLVSLVPIVLGEEPRYHLGRCLAAMGRHAEARELFTDITRKYRKGGAIWRRAEKNWFKLARRALDELERLPPPASGTAR
ncbi:MAG TPA: hypothetical protein VK178_12650 [Opitutaceae bacterium]|nr:hypothetical protein [Opitutaceae bacterium]